MAYTKSVHVLVSRTFNTGNYESIRLEIGLDADTQDWIDSTQTLFRDCINQLNREAEALSLSPTKVK